jgi:hypothetical protein
MRHLDQPASAYGVALSPEVAELYQAMTTDPVPGDFAFHLRHRDVRQVLAAPTFHLATAEDLAHVRHWLGRLKPRQLRAALDKTVKGFDALAGDPARLTSALAAVRMLAEELAARPVRSRRKKKGQ